jgi:hypothetical protein
MSKDRALLLRCWSTSPQHCQYHSQLEWRIKEEEDHRILEGGCEGTRVVDHCIY